MSGTRCCCSGTNCNCVALSSVVVTWDGSVTYEAECVPGVCNDGTYYSMSPVTYSDIAIVCNRVEGSGFCLYEGTYEATITMTNCEDRSIRFSAIFQVYAQAYYALGNWHAAFNFRMSGCTGTCSWHTGGFSNADMEHTSDQVSAAGDCPALETYTDSSACNPSLTIGDACSNGCPQVTAYTAGTLTVS